MARVRFREHTYFEGVSYALNSVVDLDSKTIKALGDSVEPADDRDIEQENREVAEGDVDVRAEKTVQREADDAQDIPDAARDNDFEAEATQEAKALGAAPTNKMVEKAPKKK